MRERAPKVLRGPVPRNKEDEQVVYIDGDSAPRVMFSGEDLLLEDLPIGTRVLYPKPPMEGLANPGAAIRYALNHPLDADPLYAQLAPGMSVTIALDDISLPLPPMVHARHPADWCWRSCSSSWTPTASTTCTSSSRPRCTGA